VFFDKDCIRPDNMLAHNDCIKNGCRLPDRVRLSFYNLDWWCFHPYGVVHDPVDKNLLRLAACEEAEGKNQYGEEFAGHLSGVATMEVLVYEN
jgi:hypothetical protein